MARKTISTIHPLSSGAGAAGHRVNSSLVLDNLPVGILVCALNGKGVIDVLLVNRFARAVFDQPDTLPIPCHLDQLWADDEHSLATSLISAFRDEKETIFEWTIGEGPGERFLISRSTPITDHQGKVSQIICTIQDQTAEKLAERTLLHHAHHDTLTGLPNRLLFYSDLEKKLSTLGPILEHSEDNRAIHAVMIVNVDRFQLINESFGHGAGDQFLVSVSSVLRRCIRTNDMLARLSGDEFAILVDKCDAVKEIDIIADRIHDAMRAPFDVDGHQLFVSVSIGVATTLSSSHHPEDLIRGADFAMHAAKARGKSRTEFYRRDTHSRARSQFHLETELRKAVERRDLTLAYQPIVDLQGGTLAGFEALARWAHPEQGDIPPAEFIPLAEETGIIVGLGAWALHAACQQIKTWVDEFGEDAVPPINVNVSGVQFARDDVVALTKAGLETAGIKGGKLRLEMTESALMTSPSTVALALDRIRRMDVNVALDDFGTGYSSLTYLHRFPIDVLKIDRSFITQLEFHNQQYRILGMISSMAAALGLSIVAEGIEDAEHVKMIKKLGFNCAQGFLLSKPVDAAAARLMISDADLPWASLVSGTD